MKTQRHKNPLVDTRRPSDGAYAATNPPVFAWRADGGANSWSLTVSKDREQRDKIIDLNNLEIPYHLPSKALQPGRYFWSWAGGRSGGELFSFEIRPEAAVLEVPEVDGLLAAMPAAHPRIWIRPEYVSALRESRFSSRKGMWGELRKAAEEFLLQPHELSEPPFIPDYHSQHEAWFHAYNKAMMDSRLFLGGAEVLALAYLASGDAKYAKAACARMASVSKWDPAGSTWIEHNDEPHMSIVNWGPVVCDWVWEHFTEDERARIAEMFRRRGELAVKFIRSFGHYGSTHYGSHHGREIVFLGTLCLVFHEEIPEARAWLEWLRPVLCGIWPMWAGEDGAWAEGPHYSVAYVCVMMRFAAALRSSTGVDLFRRPFWKGYIEWLKHCCPSDVEWTGFGDGAKLRGKADHFTADVVRLIACFTGSRGFNGYVNKICPGRSLMAERVDLSYPSPMVYLFNPEDKGDGEGIEDKDVGKRMLKVFPGAGWAALHTSLGNTASDICLTFRSSPYGSVSHSHADNNDFTLHAGGKSLLIPSGVYDGWATKHHSHWVWHTKSANCITLSDAGQLMRSEDSTGMIEDAFEDGRIVYFLGNADASYHDRALRCRRHVLYLKPHNAFLIVDEFEARPGIASSLQWNAHAWSEFNIDEKEISFRVERDGSSVNGHILWHAEGFFTLTDKADPPPLNDGFDRLPFTEYNLRFTPWGLVDKVRNLGVLLCPELSTARRACVSSERMDGVEVARIGDDIVHVYPESFSHANGRKIVAQINLCGTEYQIGDGSIYIKKSN